MVVSAVHKQTITIKFSNEHAFVYATATSQQSASLANEGEALVVDCMITARGALETGLTVTKLLFFLAASAFWAAAAASAAFSSSVSSSGRPSLRLLARLSSSVNKCN